MAEGATIFTNRPDGNVNGRMRGTGAWKLRATVHTHGGRAHALDAHVVNGSAGKTMAGPFGTFSITAKARALIGGVEQTRVWDDLVEPGDWIEIAAANGRDERPLQIGRIDSVSRGRAAGPDGVQVTTYTFNGGDLGRLLALTSLTDMRAISLSRIAAQVNALGAANALAAVSKLTPDAVVRFLFDYSLAGGAYRHPTARCWAVPPTLALPGSAGPGRQLHDLVSFDYVTGAMEGLLAASVAFASSLPGAGRCWDTMAQYANLALNELFLDLRPPLSQQHDTSGANLRPSLVFREKPFPHLPESAPWRTASFGAAWSALPITVIHAFDPENETLARNDAERTNYWSFISGGTEASYRDVVTEATFRSGRAALDGGAPRLHLSSIEQHQLRRMEQQSLYVDPAAIAGLTAGAEPNGWMLYTGWTGLIRDWYAPNHRFLAGTIPLAFALPGIRVGERLQVVYPNGEAVELYVEGVDHSFRRSANGTPAGRTRLTVTRGLKLGSGGYAQAYRDELNRVLAA